MKVISKYLRHSSKIKMVSILFYHVGFEREVIIEKQNKARA